MLLFGYRWKHFKNNSNIIPAPEGVSSSDESILIIFGFSACGFAALSAEPSSRFALLAERTGLMTDDFLADEGASLAAADASASAAFLAGTGASLAAADASASAALLAMNAARRIP